MAGFNALAAVQDGYDFAQKVRNQGNALAAGRAYADGNTDQAANIFAAGGDIGSAQKLQDRQQELDENSRKQHAQVILQATGAIRNYKRMKPDATPQEAFDAVAPALGSISSPEKLAQFRDQFAQNPDGFLALVEGEAHKALQPVNMGNGGVGAFDPNERDPQKAFTVLREPARAPVSVAPGGSLVNPQTGEQVYQAPERKVGGAWHEKTNPDGSTSMVWLPNDPSGAGGSSPPGATPGPQSAITTESLAAFATQVLPGATINSGLRSPANNTKVGGVANSYHMPDANGISHAADIRPPPGMTVAEAAQRLKANAPPGVQVIAEPAKNHVHLEPAKSAGPSQAAGSTAIPWDSGKPGGLTPNQQRQASVQLRKEFDQHPDVKQFQTVATQYGIVNRLATQAPTAANDISLIFAYMKLLDPTSVVREGEFATAQNATGIPGQVANAYNKALKGERLNPEQRRQFVASAGNVFGENESRYKQLVGQYQGYARDSGLPDSTIQPRIAPSGGGAKASAGPAPAPQDAAKRQKGAIYDTPKGPLKWVGNGWVKP